MDELERVIAALDERARADRRLEKYRVRGAGPQVLDAIPAGWFVSDAIARLAVRGGWWPGAWSPNVREGDMFSEFIVDLHDVADEPTVRWLCVGSVWEKDFFYSPLLREPAPDAPLAGSSAQALWLSMAFPTEASMLEAFLVTYDEMGFEEGFGPDDPMVNPDFVEWVTDPPMPEPPGSDVVHRRLVELSRGWRSTHPCWDPATMPQLEADRLPDTMVRRMTGTAR